MLKLKHWVSGLAFAVTCATAGAGMHQICYEGVSEYKNQAWTPNGIFGCAIDGSGFCTITPVTTGFMSRSSYPLYQGVQTAGSFSYYDFSSSAGTFTAKMEFFDSNSVKVGERRCTINAQGVYTSSRGPASSGAVLTGFSSDESGLVTTGVWKLVGATTAWRRLPVSVPFDFVAVGGGAMGVENPMGALIANSEPYVSYAGDTRSWIATTLEAGGAAQQHQTTAFVIGMHIEGVASRDLAPLLQTVTGTSFPAVTASASAQASQASGSVLLGGGMEGVADGSNAINMLGQLATVSAPVVTTVFQCVRGRNCQAVQMATGWRAESKDHVVAHPGWDNVQALSLPATIVVAGTSYEIVSKLVSATSAVAAHPATDVSGLRGEFALTGVGAAVDWRRLDQFGNQTAAGNLLWRLEPRADLGGASVASKDHVISSPASITGYAIGIKLVIPTPPPVIICCRTFP